VIDLAQANSANPAELGIYCCHWRRISDAGGQSLQTLMYQCHKLKRTIDGDFQRVANQGNARPRQSCDPSLRGQSRYISLRTVREKLGNVGSMGTISKLLQQCLRKED
jgi:hypothetical protein